ncbi:uracil-DNA glycosylase [Gluconobacter morbifer]|uniref:Bacteriophage-type DNA polymerase n=1 Tax=Gluconobacter morbifer G707 TaxID=1088869 RepID=G6XFK5_9PROT|nr:uracil-DNA glycosylase [Gluconobacter morbifer]EHH68963.1 bacteriophage-type DNA polymerase [Gluconobacter morbifer G707]
MTPQPVPSRAELLAALQLQYEWGVDEVLSETPIDRLAEAPRSLPPRPVPAGGPSAGAGPVRTARPAEKDVALEQAPDLPTLIRLSEALDDLFLARTATHRLEPLSVADAPFMLVGETPDAAEDRSGTLFAGRAGVLLDAMLSSVGLTRDMLSMAPAIPWRPPGGRSATEQEMRACRPLLLRTIALCRPPVLVTMGATPLKMLLGEQAMLNRMRGRWAEVSIPGCPELLPLLPMRHPLQLSASPAARRNAWQDLLLLMDRVRPSETGLPVSG